MIDTKKTGVYLIGSEDKDVYCLAPLEEELSKRFDKVHLLKSIYHEVQKPGYGALSSFSKEECPVVISSSILVFEQIEHVRNRESYVSIGIEHGIAPYKAYTYGAHFQRHDAYLAPTPLWKDRLEKLYPDNKTKFILGGYPRLDHLSDLKKISSTSANASLPLKWISAPKPSRKLVLFSWGVSPEALDTLPDREDIVYLFHPASSHILKATPFKKATRLVSSPELTTSLLMEAGAIFGDFSSITLEAMALGLPVQMFIDRKLYLSNCDLGESFFRRGTPGFARPPHTSYALDPNSIKDAVQLAEALAADQPPPPSSLAVDTAFLPPRGIDNRQFCADAILNFLTNNYSALASKAHRRDSWKEVLGFMKYLSSAYQSALGRNFDKSGLNHYMALAKKSTEPAPVIAAKIMITIMNSPEAKSKQRVSQSSWPVIPADWLHPRA